MSRSILIPLDGSSFSEQALPLARTVAGRQGARLEIVHVHDRQSDAEWELLTPFRYAGLERSEREWDGAEKQHEEEYLHGQLDGSVCKVLEGPIVASLEEEIAAADPDLIIMTTHGRGGFSRAWLGSVADQLIREAHKPILLVRGSEEEPKAVDAKLDRILIPLDGSPLAESVLAHAMSLAEPETSRITLLRVVAPAYVATEFNALAESEKVLQERVETAHAYLGDLATRLSVEGYLVDTDVVVSSLPAATILDYARRHQVELICMATHGRSGVKRLLLGSVADKVLRAAEIPILIYRP
jgi:nucleotide-binding universal stress UspA family protein